MSERTEIEWADATWSPIWTCTQISPACDNCYAKALAHRFGYGWNGEGPARLFGEHHWNQPVRWNRRAQADGNRPRVFPSMCDPFDKDWPAGTFARFCALIRATPNLTWLLLSKRVGNWRARIDEARRDAINALPTDKDLYRWLDDWRDAAAPANVWIGSTVINQEEADRDVPKLLATPARVRFLSIEPMLGPIDLTHWIGNEPAIGASTYNDGGYYRCDLTGTPVDGIHWVIAGGESGPYARPAHPDWFRSLRDQCAAAGVPFLFKQWGEHSPGEIAPHPQHADGAWRLDQRGERWHDPMEGLRPPGEWAPIKFLRVGKKAAGRLLDGVQHDGVPSLTSPLHRRRTASTSPASRRAGS